MLVIDINSPWFKRHQAIINGLDLISGTRDNEDRQALLRDTFQEFGRCLLMLEEDKAYTSRERKEIALFLLDKLRGKFSDRTGLILDEEVWREIDMPADASGARGLTSEIEPTDTLMVQQLKSMAKAYKEALDKAGALLFPIANDSHKRTYTLKFSDSPTKCRLFFQEFLEDHQTLGVILLGEDPNTMKGVQRADLIANMPTAAGKNLGRCMWLLQRETLRSEIQAACPGLPPDVDYAKISMIFLPKNRSKAGAVLTVTDSHLSANILKCYLETEKIDLEQEGS